MGYETTLIFVDTYGHKNGYHNVQASLEMNKIAYDESIRDLLDKIQKQFETKDRLKEEIKTFENLHREIYNYDGDYLEYDTNGEEIKEKDREKKLEKLRKLQAKLEKTIPFIYWDTYEFEQFTDDWGDLLLITTLKELEKAIQEANAREILNNKYSDYKYELALKMIEGFKINKHIKVILWGH